MTLVSSLGSLPVRAHWFSPSRLPALMVLPANALMLWAGVEGARPAYLMGGLFGLIGCLAILRWADRTSPPAPSRWQAFLPWHDAWRFCGALSLLNGVCFGLVGLSQMHADEILISVCTLLAAGLLLLPECPQRPTVRFNRLAFLYAYTLLTQRPTRASAIAYGLASTTIMLSGLLGADLARAFSGAWFLTASALQARTSKLYAAT